MYATSTGIKWDFDQETLLAGQVVRIFSYTLCFVNVSYTHYILVSLFVKQAVQPKGSIRRFSIDPNDYSNFEIANHLWSLMETGTYAASITSE